MMQCHDICEPIETVRCDACVVGIFEDRPFDPLIRQLDDSFSGYLSRCREEGEIRGKLGEMTIIHAPLELGPRRVLCYGLGKSESISYDIIRRMAAESARKVRDINCRIVLYALPDLELLPDVHDVALTITEGALLGQYRFRKYFSREHLNEIETMLVHVPDRTHVSAIHEAVLQGCVFGEETNFSKDICNEPSNVVTPLKMVEIAKEFASEHNIEIKILDREEIIAQGMGLIEAVSRGSIEPPYVIDLVYRGGTNNGVTIGLVGKGITFDSGGVSLKSDHGMYTMKRDLTGGAVVMALLKAAARLALPLTIIGIIPCAENMPGGKAYKPGDIIPSMSGKNVEIFNTDAEGRLLLADALTYIQKEYHPDIIIDIATLTGGAMHAVGPRIIPFFSTCPDCSRSLLAAGKTAGESLWEFPLFEEYRERVNSHFADIKNDSDKPPQTIVGALFLKEFVEPGARWMHLDIAAQDTSDAEYSYISRGASGVAVRPLLHFLKSQISGERISRIE